MQSNPFLRVVLVHVGFHALWVLLYLISLFGLFLFIPLIGWYQAFVLGFLGKAALISATRAALLGFVVFGVTGLLSGWAVSAIPPKSLWMPAFLSLFLTCVLLVGASWMHHKAVGVAGMRDVFSIPTTTGRVDVDQLSMALKTEYDMLDPAVPLHLDGKGVLVPLADLQPSLQLLPKGFQMQGGPYVYCNLPSEVWKGLKKHAARNYPILWSTQADTAGNHLLMSVDLKTDFFSDELVTAESLKHLLTELEAAVRKQTGDPNFTLPEIDPVSRKEGEDKP